MAATIRELASTVSNDPHLAAAFQQDPVGELQKQAALSPIPDTFVYRMVVAVIGVALLGSLAAAVYLHEKIPEFIVAIGSGALGALAGLLAPSPRANG